MTIASHRRPDWVIQVGAVLWFLGGVAFLLGLAVLLPLSSWIVVVLIVLAIVLAAPLAWLMRRFHSSEGQPYWRALARGSLALTFLLTFLAAAPLLTFAFITDLRPALAPQVTLTNGKKTVIFQGMQHVAADSFYRSVIFDLEDALSKGYVLYFEGVRFDDPAANRWLNNLLFGDKDLTTSYSDLGRICGLKQQNDYFRLLGADAKANPQRHIPADVSTRDMLREYQRLMRSDPAFVQAMKNREPSRGGVNSDRLLAFLAKATPTQRADAGIACRGFMSWATNRAEKSGKGDALDPVILDYRNRELARRVINDPNSRIFITYGAQHLPGLYANLRKADPNWRVTSTRWLRTIDQPEEYHRSLKL